MKSNLILFFLFIFFSCSSSKQDNYNKLKLSDIKKSYLIDTNGAVLDTFPHLIKIIKNYSFKNVDTSRIKFSNSKLAIDFAISKLDSVYGKEQINSEKPFAISLIENKFWYVTGTLPEGYLGGVAEILFSKYDGKILYLIHGK